MAKQTNVFSLKTFCVITGASKGFGQSLAINFAKHFPKDSFLFLLARSKEGLANTRMEVLKVAPHVIVATHPIDLGEQDASSLDNLLQGVMLEYGISKDKFEQYFIVHNVGSLGDVSKNLAGQNDLQSLKTYWDLNLSSVVVLNSVFINYFRGNAKENIVVMNISSICALQPFKSWSLYCAGKAARDMLFRTMAEEEPDIRVLNYAPGPIDTDMQHEARTITGDKQLKDMFADMKSQGKLLSCDQSVAKLIKLLQQNKFDSGAHIDYYDI